MRPPLPGTPGDEPGVLGLSALKFCDNGNSLRAESADTVNRTRNFCVSGLMTQFNPLAGSILQSGHVARQQAASKAAQVRRSQQLLRNVAQRDDEMEHQVESSEELTPIHDREGQGQQGQGGQHQGKPGGDGDGDNQPHIDLRA